MSTSESDRAVTSEVDRLRAERDALQTQVETLRRRQRRRAACGRGRAGRARMRVADRRHGGVVGGAHAVDQRWVGGHRRPAVLQQDQRGRRVLGDLTHHVPRLVLVEDAPRLWDGGLTNLRSALDPLFPSDPRPIRAPTLAPKSACSAPLIWLSCSVVTSPSASLYTASASITRTISVSRSRSSSLRTSPSKSGWSNPNTSNWTGPNAITHLCSGHHQVAPHHDHPHPPTNHPDRVTHPRLISDPPSRG
jgi:hypothetical protein